MTNKLSTKYWLDYMLNNGNKKEQEVLAKKMILSLKKEIPSLLSVVFERTCNLNCKHCFYPKDKSSVEISKKVNLSNVIKSMVLQIPKKSIIGESSQFLHSGRILSEDHINTMAEIRELRKDISIGMINNGSYVNLIEKFKEKKLLLDWVDVSLDGNKNAHNKQRGNERAFDMATNGLKQARKIIKQNGYVASLFTLTNINYNTILETADILLTPRKENNNLPLADIMAITTMTPTNCINENIEASANFTNDNKHFEIAWQQIKKATKKYGSNKLVVHIYRHNDIEKLAHIVSAKKFMQALKNNSVSIGLHDIEFELEGVPIRYSPMSLWPKEELIIDADAVARTALSGSYSLAEYKVGFDKKGNDIKKYSVKKITTEDDYINIYHKVVNRWKNKFLNEFLKKEKGVFDRIKNHK